MDTQQGHAAWKCLDMDGNAAWKCLDMDGRAAWKCLDMDGRAKYLCSMDILHEYAAWMRNMSE
jgi:hypothetical protein